MADASAVRWTLWIYAGPGALPEDVPGALLPLTAALGELPAGVGMLAETVGTPTLLQQLTGEWPTERLSLGLGVQAPPAERSLQRFVEWASERTPTGSRRALLVLGDVLRAIGESPKALVPGDYRPPYPARITVKSKGNPTNYDATDDTRSSTTTYGTRTISGWLTALAQDDSITFGSGPTYTRTSVAGQFSSTSSTLGYFTIDASSTPIKISRHLAYPTSITITWNSKSSQPTTTYSTGDTSPNRFSAYKDADGNEDELLGWASQLGLNDTIRFGTSATYALEELTTRHYTSDDGWSYYYTLAFSKTTIDINDTGITVPSSSRGLDDVGPVDVDPSTRRIDALAAALGDRGVDLLVSDEGDLLQLASLRRLAPRTHVLVGARPARMSPEQPLRALLEVLRSPAALDPEQLSAQLVEQAGPSAGLVALRGSKATRLVAALEGLAARAVAGSSTRRCFEAAWDEGSGGDLTDLTTKLEAVDRDQATTIEALAADAVLAPPFASGSRLGIAMDGPGLQLGPRSNWTRLLDDVGAHTDIERTTIQDILAQTGNEQRGRQPTSREPARASCVLEYCGAAASERTTPDRDLAGFLARELERCQARHVVLVVRGEWKPQRPGSVTFADGSSLPITSLARHLRRALGRRGRGPLALLVFEDPELLRIEVAYELRKVAHALLTTVTGAVLPASPWITKRVDEVVRGCEQAAAEALGSVTTASASLAQRWRDDVVDRLASQLVAPLATLQGIVLRHIDALCNLFDRLCHRMLENLDDPAVLAATKAGEGAPSMVEWINWVQMNGFARQADASRRAREIHDAWGELYNWITQSSSASKEAGAAFWADPNFKEDRNPRGYCSRLRISVGPHQPQDYREASFHRGVSLHALLTAARVLDIGQARAHWGLISMGLAYGPSVERHEQLEQLVGEGSAATYFEVLDTAPLISLGIYPASKGYDLRLRSSMSQAVLIEAQSDIDPASVDGSFERLAYVMSRSMASDDGWKYLEKLGGELARAVIGTLQESLEGEREQLLRSDPRHGAHLALTLPPALMRYPWELLQLPSKGRGPQLLAERFAVGRQIWAHHSRARLDVDGCVRVLVVANPRTSCGDLPAARAEGEELRQRLADMRAELQIGKNPKILGTFEHEAHIDEQVSREDLLGLLRSGRYDVLHFAGHGTYSADDPGASGWMLSDGLLTIPMLSETLAKCPVPPWLIYANACSAGMVGRAPSSRYDGDLHGMATACIRAGVSAYVAPLWRIHDESARLLAGVFYRRLLLERTTIGIALQRARLQVREYWEDLNGSEGLGDLSWAGMVLFGNPRVRLREIVS